MSLTLRPYQVEAKAEVLGIEPGAPGLIALPTGTGKTVVFSSALIERGTSGLILAHRDELLKQARDKLIQVAPELEMGIGFVKGKLDNHGSQIVVASVQTLARQARLRRIPREWGLVVVDEAHHSVADSYKRIMEHVGGSPIAGFTATAGRKGLGDLFTMRYQKTLLEMILAGYLCDLRGVRVELDLDLSKVRRSRGDFVDSDLGEAMEGADASDRTVEAWQEHAAGRRGLVFCPTVAVSKEMAASFSAAGIKAAHLDGTTESGRRATILRQLRTSELDVVSNVGVLTEGFDEPSIDCVVVATPTKSEIKYAQIVGRGTRLHPGKSNCLVLDLVGASDEMSIEGVAKLVGASKIKPGETATEAVSREDGESKARTAQERLESERRRKAKLKSRDFGFFSRDRINWHRIEERYAIDVGEGEFVVLDPGANGDGSSYRVLLLLKRAARVLARDLDLGYAQGVAEELIRDRGRVAIADKEARWRHDPATQGQRNKARHMGVELDAGATKGEAADAITGAILDERLERLDAAEMARENRQPNERQPA